MNKENQHLTQDDVGDEEIKWTGQPARESQLPSVLISILLLPIGVGVLVLLEAYIRVNYTTYSVTDRALYKKRGLLSDKTKRVPLSKIQNTEYSRSFVEKQFDFGSVNVSSAGSSGKELRFRAVQDPKGVQKLINRLSKDQNEKSDHKEDSVRMGQKEMAEEIRKTRENLEQITDYLKHKE